jgi:DNA-binding CsgD family transcriptional regulator
VVWPLVGRHRQLGSVERLLSDDSAGGMVVAGAAGVGKTRLAAEVSRVAESSGFAVEWVRATRAAATIPLGAFAALLPATGAASGGGADLLLLARHALAERAGGRRLVLCVDDGQLLDDGSAALVHQLVAAGEAFAVVTVRLGEAAPDALQALWKDELCELVQLEALSRPEVEHLLGLALGGPVDGRSATALWDLTLGNPLFLRELVHYGVDHGFLTDQGEIWRWRGEMAPGMRLTELVGARLDTLGAAALAALQVVAVGAPLEVGLLEPEERAALEQLELQEIVELRADGRRRFVDVAHPLHGEVVRSRLARTRLEAIQRRLADAVEAHGARRRTDVPRLAAWRLESGGARDPALFERAALHALDAYDVALAERFARAAVEAGGGFAARLALGRALAGDGRAAEADELLRGLGEQAGDDSERMAVAIARARNLFWGLGRPDDADAALEEAQLEVSDAGLHGELAAQRIRLVAARGRPLEALAAATPLLKDADARDQARVHAAVAAVEALLSSGRTDRALELADTWLPVARRQREELPLMELVPLLELVLLSERAFALRFAGRLVEATEVSEPLYRRAAAQHSAQNNAVEASSLGFIWLARGRVRTALRLCREGASLLRDADAVGMLPWALAGVAQAAAQAGEPDLARAALEEMEGRPLGHRGFEHELGLARAWGAAAAGELSRARVEARETAALAESRGQRALAVRALHELCRLGDPAVAAPELSRLAGEVDGPFAAIAAAHAAALAERDGRALLDAAERLAGQDALLAAAEAAHAAAEAHRDAGRAASARAAAARAAVWLDRCEGARPPTLQGARVATELTPREREIALLAASGLSSRQIAERLVVSVRTVDNHLQRAYRKLGVTRRGDLAQIFE